MAEGGYAWQRGMSSRGACMAGDMHGGGHVCLRGGGHAWQERWPLQRTDRILLECILVLHEERLNYVRSEWTSKNLENSEKLRKLEISWVFHVSQCLIQSEVEKIILVKSRLYEVRFNPREVTIPEMINTQCDYSPLDICLISFNMGGTQTVLVMQVSLMVNNIHLINFIDNYRSYLAYGYQHCRV